MTYNVISTGSKGNAVVIDNRILIDCGVPYKRLVGIINHLQLVLLTHIHSDHFRPSTAAALHSHRPGLRFGCCEWMLEPLINAGIPRHCIDIYHPGIPAAYNSALMVRAENLSHNVPNCGYHITIDGKKMFYATDTGTLDGIKAKDYDLYMIEANHRRSDLEARISKKQAAGEFSYEIGAIENHLSQEQAEEWIYQNIGPAGRYIFLHQHIEKEEVPDGVDRSTSGTT